MRKLRLTVLSLWSWAVMGLCVGVWLPTMVVVRVVTTPFDKSHYWTGLLFRKLAVVHQRLNPLWHFRVTGKLPTDPRRPYVVVSNHESFVDILLISHLPWDMKWLSKAEMFKIPFVGWLMRLAGDVPVSRGTTESANEALRTCREYLADHVSIMVFPEGTRSETGELQRFKGGAFRLAIEAGVPVLPLAVTGTRTALRKHDWRQGDSTAEVRVLEPIPTDGLTLSDTHRLKNQVRARIAAALDEMRAEHPFELEA